jgi:hypothetical protein
VSSILAISDMNHPQYPSPTGQYGETPVRLRSQPVAHSLFTVTYASPVPAQWDSLQAIEGGTFEATNRAETLQMIASSYPLSHAHYALILPSSEKFIYSDKPEVHKRELCYDLFRQAYSHDLIQAVGLEEFNRMFAESFRIQPNFWLVSEAPFYVKIREWIYGSGEPRPFPSAVWYIGSDMALERAAKLYPKQAKYPVPLPRLSVGEHTYATEYGEI